MWLRDDPQHEALLHEIRASWGDVGEQTRQSIKKLSRSE